ncbi:hypothetical protein ACXEO8_06995 [Cytobacillus firmus]
MTESIKTKHDAFNLKFKEHEVFKDKLVVVDDTDTPYLWLDRESGKVSFGFKYFHMYKEQRLIEALKRFVYIADEFVNGENDENVDYVSRFKNAISFVEEIEQELIQKQQQEIEVLTNLKGTLEEANHGMQGKIEEQQQEIERLKEAEFKACSKHHEFIEDIEALEKDIRTIKDFAVACDADERAIQPYEILDLINTR